MNALASTLDALLPQTQCTRCGYPACAPYAEAMADGSAGHNLCEPGGQPVLLELAQALGQVPLPPAHAEAHLQLAWIREEDCIGCARCLPACPVDAILGTRRMSHTVLEADCTGCTLCLAACPVDCIELHAPPAHWQAPAAALNRERHAAHLARLQRRHWHVRPLRVRAPVTPPAERAAAPAAAVDDRAARRAAMIAAARAAAAARRQSR